MTDAQSRSTLLVFLDQVIQSDFLGVNATYHGFAFMPEQTDRGMNDADRQREFERVSQLGLNIARTWYRPDWAYGDSLANIADWNSEKMTDFYRWLDAMKMRNVDVALQAGWWFTRDTYYGSPEPDPGRDIDLYTRWVSESLDQIIMARGFDNVRYLVLFTEPTSYESGIIPQGETQWSYYVRVVKALHQRLLIAGQRGLVRLVGPNNAFQGVHLAEAAAELDGVIDIYSGHDYNQPGYAEWYNVCQSMQQKVSATGKPFWLDEYGLQNEALRQKGDYGNYLAQAVAASLNAGHQSSFLWLLFDQQYVSDNASSVQLVTNADSFYEGVHRWGVWKWPHDTLESPQEPYPHWYAFSLLSRYLGGRNHTRVLAAQGSAEVVAAATRPAGGDVTILLVNTTAKEQPVEVRLDRPLNRTLYRYMYVPEDIRVTPTGEMIGYSRVDERVTEAFTDDLPEGAVALYSTVQGGAGQPPPAPLWLNAGRDTRGRGVLTWMDRSKNECGFRIERWNLDTGETSANIAAPDAKEYTDETAQPGSNYAYRVCAFNNDGRSGWVYAELR